MSKILDQDKGLSSLQLLFCLFVWFFSGLRKQCRKVRRTGQEGGIMAGNEIMQLHMLAVCVINMSFQFSFDFIFSYEKMSSFSSHSGKEEIK